jgi:hypothetical protein
MHDSRCKKLWHLVHKSARDLVHSLLCSANLASKKEVRNLFSDGTDDRPADILLTNPSGKQVCLDLSCFSYAKKDGLSKRDELKLLKYSPRCEKVNLEFIPLSFNNLGWVITQIQRVY